ncbi:MAG TPA: lytic transglycosylase domain-containing protein [Terriglobales bacterium]|nr:lytic transglycosylase domain-containing protein [Terriglobales bacterium]
MLVGPVKIWLKVVSFLALAVASSAALASDVAVLRNGFSIRHERREVTGSVTRLYLTADGSGYVDVSTEQIDRFEKDLSPAVPATRPENSQKLDAVINSIGDLHHIDPDLINSVIHAESGFNPRAVSPKGAQGLMQLMPQTASHLGVANAFDPRANVEGGTRYLRELLERYNFDLIKALAAYNAGPHRVEQYRGVPPYFETRAYVARVVRDFNRKKLAERKTSTKAKTISKVQARRPATAKQAAPPVLAQQTSH